MSGLLKFFQEDQNLIQKGEFKYNSNFVLEVKINGFQISATVRASMKDKSYKAGMSVDGTGSILTATCECPRGQWICSHMAAASIYVNKKGLSKTDLPNSWIARPKTSEKQTGTRTMQQLFPSTKPLFKAVQRSLTQEAQQSVLGCSPDGVVFPKEDPRIYGALEIKCPWKHRDDTIQEMLAKECATDSLRKKFFLTKDLQLNPAHDYWHQVQAEMTMLETTWAHFVVWTTKDIAIIKVDKDLSWEINNIPKLSHFYLNELLPSCYTTED